MSNRYDFNPNSQNFQPFAIGVGLFFVAVILLQSFTIIEPGYVGISVTLGSIDQNYRQAGLNFKVPFIERILKVPVKQITVEGMAECYSSDLQTVNVDYRALYRLPDAKVVNLYEKIQGDPYDNLVEPRIQDALKQVTAQYRAEDLVKNREHVKQKALKIIRNTLRLPLGTDFSDKTPEEIEELVSNNAVPWVYIEDLPINNIELTKELEQAIELKQIKEQEALAKEYELRKATKQAEITVVNAEAEAKAVKIKGQALRTAPEVIELEIAKKWDGKTPTTVVVGKGGGNVLLPLR